MQWLHTGGIDPAIWGFLGMLSTAIVGALALVFVEMIRGRKSTENVRQVVVDTQKEQGDKLDLLSSDVNAMREKLDDHIRWHLGQSQPLRIGRYRQ